MDHATFNRDGLDLIMEKEISIVEALCGFTFVVDHLDGRKLAVQNKPNQIISPSKHACVCMLTQWNFLIEKILLDTNQNSDKLIMMTTGFVTSSSRYLTLLAMDVIALFSITLVF